MVDDQQAAAKRRRWALIAAGAIFIYVVGPFVDADRVPYFDGGPVVAGQREVKP